ncbi:hypothetical protein FA95DRAFT_1485012 [Auriscalpium vulgare]|uniref:Uncharacterized protein n=1 Tax=Auriscalpium vulgare TaxID=40419 RepID=A0ACB8S6L9_9AGAM|nr:hypothetical protein FA95DRAFT_1485012 [Auriscalpium vulgare]
MSTPDRLDLIRNAVSFLTDPKAQGSPFAQRIQFLEAKGLTGPEIEDAMRQAAAYNSTAQASTYQPAYGPVYGPHPYAPQSNEWDWRDYFITAIVSGTVVYGAVALAKKYLLPHLQPPSTTAYEADRDALTAQFDAAEAILRDIQAETAAVKTAVVAQQEKVDKATADVDAAVQQMRDGEIKTRDEMREIREEVNNIRDMLPKMIDKNKEVQAQSLAELQQELKSLKALLLSRGPTLSNATTPSLPSFSHRPSIPAWQLAGSSSTAVPTLPFPSPGTGPVSPSPSTSFTPPPIAAALTNGKAKAVESDETELAS